MNEQNKNNKLRCRGLLCVAEGEYEDERETNWISEEGGLGRDDRENVGVTKMKEKGLRGMREVIFCGVAREREFCEGRCIITWKRVSRRSLEVEEEVEPVMHGSDDGGCEQGHEECQEVGDGECEVPVSEGKMEGECYVGKSERDDVVEGEIEAECHVGETERDDVVQGQIETECHVSESEKDDVVCDVGESEGDDGDVRSWSSSGEDDNVDCNADVPSMDDLVDYDIQEEVGHGVGNWFGEIEVDVQDDAPSWTRISDSDEDVGINTNNDRGLSDDNWESEELLKDDEQESYGKFVTFSMPKTMVDYKWDLGTYFANKQDIMDAIKTYTVENGRNLTYVKTDKKRIRLKCMGAKGKCLWMTYYGYMNAVRTWQLRTIVDNHTCNREHKVKLLNSKWLSKRLEKTISRKWNVGVSRSMAFRAKSIASDHADRCFKEQYKKIYDYANELLERNPGSTVKVEVEENVGKYGGELLTAIARDANDQMLPLAYAIVKVENKETWKWFLELLVEDIGGKAVQASLTFISDQQKGLMQAFEEVLPRVDQLFCVRHLYANFRKIFSGKQLKRMMFTTTAKCDTLVNNVPEAFNSVLVHTRSEPIITMLEEICLYLMNKWATNRTKSQSMYGSICPKIKSRLNKESQLTKFCIPRKWAISVIPCCHALAAMKFLNLDAEEFIPNISREAQEEKKIAGMRVSQGRNKNEERTSCQKSTQDGDVNPDQTQQRNPGTEENIPSSNEP
ncbi:hypothetical protein V8G54_011662 [Vigna mungo]|uniref:Zinc finger PMZ-type domain-containing protein n=1 Tax=Vigna mungo TaxID=3915 RepID=A0AAQ3NQ08_VIGMU